MVHSPNNKDWIEATYDGFDFEKSDGVINKSSEFEDRLNYIKENFTIIRWETDHCFKAFRHSLVRYYFFSF